MRRLIVLAALLALVATACKIETNLGAVINADGSGTIMAELGLDEEAAGFFLQDGTDPFEGNDLSGLPNAQTREETRGDMTFYIIEADVDDISSIENDLLNNNDSLLSNLDITVTNDMVSVTGSANADQLSGQAEGFDPSVFEDAVKASVFFTMPGRIISHNADRQVGNTLYWDIPVLGGSLDIQAQSDPNGTPAGGGGGFPVWAYGVIALVVIAAGWYFMKGRSGGSSSGDAPAPPPPPEE